MEEIFFDQLTADYCEYVSKLSSNRFFSNKQQYKDFIRESYVYYVGLCVYLTLMNEHTKYCS